MEKIPQKIEVNLGFKATWNFQSVSVNIGITDFRHEDETMDQAVDRIYDYVEGQVLSKLDRTKKELEEVYGGKSKPKRQGQGS